MANRDNKLVLLVKFPSRMFTWLTETAQVDNWGGCYVDVSDNWKHILCTECEVNKQSYIGMSLWITPID